jgi:hypothetical protein
MDNLNTASDRMVEAQSNGNVHSLRNPSCVLPDAIVQQFLLDVIEQTSFPGKLTEHVSAVKHMLRTAQIAG